MGRIVDLREVKRSQIPHNRYSQDIFMVIHTDFSKLCGFKFIIQWLHWRINICDAYQPSFERKQMLLQVTRSQTLVGFLHLSFFFSFFIFNPDGRIVAQPGTNISPSSWLWHMDAPAPASFILHQPQPIMSACLSPRPSQPLILQPYVSLSRAITISPTCFAVMAFKFCFDLPEFPFIK